MTIFYNHTNQEMEKSVHQVNVTKLILAGLFVCLGIIIPYVTGHAFGIEGRVLLPMHIPVLMAGLLLGSRYGALCGLVTPVISSLLTGMPVLWPMLPMMTGELLTYGLTAGLLRKRFRQSLYLSLIGAMILGRIVSGLAFAILLMPPNIGVVFGTVSSAVVSGLPGILIQLIMIPGIVKLLDKVVKDLDAKDSGDISKINTLAKAIKTIESGEFSCILIRHDEIIHRDLGKGVRPLLTLLKTEEGRELMENSIVADRIIGKAAAILLVLGKAKSAYGITMSKSAKEYLQAHGIDCKFSRCVDAISDRTGRGICPLERSVMDIDDPQEGYQKIQETVAVLMGQSKIS